MSWSYVWADYIGRPWWGSESSQLWLCSLSCQLWYLPSSHAHGRSVQYPSACDVGGRYQALCNSSAWVLLPCSSHNEFPIWGTAAQGLEDWGFGFYWSPKEVLVSVASHGTGILRPLCHLEPSEKKSSWRYERKLKTLENNTEFH